MHVSWNLDGDGEMKPLECPSCGVSHDGWAQITDDDCKGPEPQDLIVCVRRGSINQLNDELELVIADKSYLDGLPSDVFALVNKAQKAVRTSVFASKNKLLWKKGE